MRRYWIAVPIAILAMAAVLIGCGESADPASSDPATSMPTALPATNTSMPTSVQPATGMSMGATQVMTQTTSPAMTETKYTVLGWNNLGMHCYNPDFSNLAILPPYNTLVAQVVKVTEPPQIVTSGVIVEYSFPENTYSAGVAGQPDKTNF